MGKLSVFNNVSLDGYFVDGSGEMSWAHNGDAEWNAFSANNASGNGTLVFGRVTYDMMRQFWPTPAAMQTMPKVAERMNAARKIVFSRSIDTPDWSNTTLIKDDMAGRVRALKAEDGNDMVVLGSGNVVAQLTEAGLVDSFTIVVVPVVLGSGRTMFEGVTSRPKLKLIKSRAFGNGNVVLSYEAMR